MTDTGLSWFGSQYLNRSHEHALMPAGGGYFTSLVLIFFQGLISCMYVGLIFNINNSNSNSDGSLTCRCIDGGKNKTKLRVRGGRGKISQYSILEQKLKTGNGIARAKSFGQTYFKANLSFKNFGRTL